MKDWLIGDGFNVWMDIENMEGSLLESMARAIENASVVLVCYSEKYKYSQNCRTGQSVFLILYMSNYSAIGESAWCGYLFVCDSFKYRNDKLM